MKITPELRQKLDRLLTEAMQLKHPSERSDTALYALASNLPELRWHNTLQRDKAVETAVQNLRARQPSGDPVDSFLREIARARRSHHSKNLRKYLFVVPLNFIQAPPVKRRVNLGTHVLSLRSLAAIKKRLAFEKALARLKSDHRTRERFGSFSYASLELYAKSDNEAIGTGSDELEFLRGLLWLANPKYTLFRAWEGPLNEVTIPPLYFFFDSDGKYLFDLELNSRQEVETITTLPSGSLATVERIAHIIYRARTEKYQKRLRLVILVLNTALSESRPAHNFLRLWQALELLTYGEPRRVPRMLGLDSLEAEVFEALRRMRNGLVHGSGSYGACQLRDVNYLLGFVERALTFCILTSQSLGSSHSIREYCRFAGLSPGDREDSRRALNRLRGKREGRSS